LLQQIVISGAHGVGVDLVTARHRANAGQFVAGRQILAQNAEQNLAHQLFANRQFAVLGDPEPHSSS
jgi:hypothetical protein